jgi:nitrite reductase/ring-hydroxylating ferredoxin subunit
MNRIVRAATVAAADPGCDLACLTRRRLLAGAGALTLGAVAGCSSYGNEAAAPVSEPSPGSPLAKTSEIPVGGGKIFDEARVVVTQPTAGTFKAFSGVCTHQGCLVNKIESGVISCPCHGSEFTLEGAVSQGPAEEPLAPQTIRVSGTEIVVS